MKKRVLAILMMILVANISYSQSMEYKPETNKREITLEQLAEFNAKVARARRQFIKNYDPTPMELAAFDNAIAKTRKQIKIVRKK